MAKVFFGYPAEPAKQAEVIHNTAKILSEELGIESVTWQQFDADGTVIMSRVLDAIVGADMCIFDLTHQNQNVLYELGFALSHGRPVWITIDTTVEAAHKDWVALGLLEPIAYTGYKNSEDLSERFRSLDPLTTLIPVYDTLIEPLAPSGPAKRSSLLYCSTFQLFESARKLDVLIENRMSKGLNVVISDPSESSFDTFDWYARKLLESAGVLVHFAGAARLNAEPYNRRHALIAGMAMGLGLPVLMLAEDDYAPPFDYKSELVIYRTAADCISKARPWLDQLDVQGTNWHRPRGELRSVLFGLRFGEHVAENEQSELADYFVETSAYADVVGARDTIFIGRRGTGKTASALQAFEELERNPDNLAVLVKPSGIEFPGLLSGIARIPDHQHDYLFDTLWRFLIETEIAAKTLQRLNARQKSVPFDAAETAFMKYVKSAPFDITADVSIRLEQAVDHLLTLTDESAKSAEQTRNLINEAFHSTALAKLRYELGGVLKGKKRVAVFIDNLDKGWEASSDLKVLARLILGLLTARGRLVSDFKRSDSRRDSIALTIAIFLRSDIFNYLKAEAREPDKLSVATIKWDDPETLIKVIELRFLSNQRSALTPDELWTKYFCESVRGQPTREFLTSWVLPRPRDIVYFVNAAVGRAIDRRHDCVKEEDFESAVETYSQYAYEALLVENGITIPQMKEALLSLLGMPAVQTRGQLLAGLRHEGLELDRCEPVLIKLIGMAVLGLEVEPDRFRYPEAGAETDRAIALARRVTADSGEQRLRVHEAFWSFLEIDWRAARDPLAVPD